MNKTNICNLIQHIKIRLPLHVPRKANILSRRNQHLHLRRVSRSMKESFKKGNKKASLKFHLHKCPAYPEAVFFLASGCIKASSKLFSALEMRKYFFLRFFKCEANFHVNKQQFFIVSASFQWCNDEHLSGSLSTGAARNEWMNEWKKDCLRVVSRFDYSQHIKHRKAFLNRFAAQKVVFSFECKSLVKPFLKHQISMGRTINLLSQQIVSIFRKGNISVQKRCQNLWLTLSSHSRLPSTWYDCDLWRFLASFSSVSHNIELNIYDIHSNVILWEFHL